VYGAGGQARIALKNDATGNASTDGFQIAVGTDSAVFIEQRENAPMAFSVNNTEGMRLTSTGLGIGTSSPVDKLQIARSLATTGTGIVSPNGITLQNTNATAGNYTTIQNRDSAGSQNAQIQFINVTHGDPFQGAIAFTTRNSTGDFAERLRLDSSGNLGLGVTPSAWYSNTKALQLNFGAFATQAVSGSTVMFNNAYESANGVFNYMTTNGAAYYRQTLGLHAWYTAPSGTAGNAITFTQAATLTAAGDFLVGMTSSNAYQRVSWSGTNSGDTSIPWANVSSIAINMATLFPSLNVGGGQTMSFMLQIVTSSSSSSATSARILCLRRGDSTWYFGSVESIGNGATVTPSGSSNTITLTFSGGGQYGMCRVQALSN
jgi:hypothetical protein